MTGSSVFDYVHHADHQEVAEQLGLGLAPQSQSQGLASPGSAGSEEGIAASTGTMNPDGKTNTSAASNAYRWWGRPARIAAVLEKAGLRALAMLLDEIS